MCDTFGHPLYVSTCFDSIHFDPRHGSCPARNACMDGIAGQISKASRALDCSRSLDKVFPRTPLEMGKKLYWMGQHCQHDNRQSRVNPLPDGTSRRSGNQKKKTRFAGLFFLTGLRPVLPLGQCPPSKPYTL